MSVSVDLGAFSLSIEEGLGAPPLIRVRSKVPLDKGWPTGPHRDPDGWRKKLDGYQGDLGVVTGCHPDRTGTGLLVVDGDRYKPEGAVTLETLEDLGLLPDTLTDETPRGGEHYFYSYNPLVHSVGCADLARHRVPGGEAPFAGGVEIKAEGGYAVLYERWRDDTEPILANVAPAPPGLLDLLARPLWQGPLSTGPWQEFDPSKVHPDTAEAVALLAEHFGAHSPLILTDGVTPYVQVVRPGKARADGRSASVGYTAPGLVKVFTDGWHPFSQGEVVDLGQLRRMTGTTPPIEVRNRITLPDGFRAWTPDDGEGLAPVLGDAAYHGVIGDYLHLLAGETEAHPAAVGAHLLAGFATMIGTRARYAAGAVEHQVNVFLAVVGLSSTGAKGVAQNEANRFVRSLDPTFLGAHTLAGLGSGEQLVWEVRDPIVADPEDLGGKKERLIQNAELSQVFRVSGREGSTLSDYLRLAYDGEPLRHSTRGGGVVSSTGHHISIVGSITPAELVRLMDDTSKANGFGNRFLYLHSEMQGFLPFGGSVDSTRITALAHRVGVRLTELDERAGHLNLAIYRLAAEAREPWASFYRHARTGIGEGVAREMTGRSVAHAVRIATIYAILDGAEAVGVEHLAAARAWVEYGAATVAQVFAASPVGAEGKLLRAIREAGPDGLTFTEQSEVFSRNLSAEELARLRDALEAQGHVVGVTSTARVGRPPNRTIAVVRTNQRNNEQRSAE